jgi:threonine synthase
LDRAAKLFEIYCTKCGRPRQSEVEWRCVCGGPFESKQEKRFDRKIIREEERSVWRYRAYLPEISESDLTSLGEGGTPLLQLEREKPSVLLKLEYINPTGSFKDRGSTVLISYAVGAAKRLGLKKVIEDSSGNAGASIAAYCARADLQCEIFVPERVQTVKLAQIEAYGARVRKIAGTRRELSSAAEAEAKDAFYASHIWNPYFTEGTKTLAYEIAELLGWKPPDMVFCPTSAGSLLIGLYKGFIHLVESGVIESIPKIVAVQSLQVSPIYHAFKGLSYSPPERLDTVADALISTEPTRKDEMLELLRRWNGDCEVVEDYEILKSVKELARLGFYVEPSSAVAHVAWKRWKRERKIDEETKVVIPLTGTGLKVGDLHQT